MSVESINLLARLIDYRLNLQAEILSVIFKWFYYCGLIKPILNLQLGRGEWLNISFHRTCSYPLSSSFSPSLTTTRVRSPCFVSMKNVSSNFISHKNTEPTTRAYFEEKTRDGCCRVLPIERESACVCVCVTASTKKKSLDKSREKPRRKKRRNRHNKMIE